MFQLLKNCLVLLFFYLCCIIVGCDDVDYVSGTEGENCTVTFRLKNIKTLKDYDQVYVYQNGTKIFTFTRNDNSCYSYLPHTLSTICMINKSKSNITLIFTNLIHNGEYYLVGFKNDFDLEESNKVNLTVHPAQYTTTNSTVTATSFSNTSFQLEQSERKSGMLVMVSVLVVFVVLVIVLLGAFYWSYWRSTDKTPAVNSTSAPQVIPDVTCVEYCVLDFPNQAGEKIRSTEERVEYSPIVFPSRKIPAQNMEMKLPTQQNQIQVTTVHCKEKAKDKVSEKEKTSKSSSDISKKSNQIKPSKDKKRRA